jgi:two-component system KDP operon response regulator KdpE
MELRTTAESVARARARLLVAEDDEDARMALGILLRDHYELVLRESVEAALRSYEQAPPDLLVVDYGLPDATGVRLLEVVRENWEQPAPAIMISAHRDRRSLSRQAGFSAFVEKPFRTLDLIWAIERALVSQLAAQGGGGQRQSALQ